MGFLERLIGPPPPVGDLGELSFAVPRDNLIAAHAFETAGRKLGYRAEVPGSTPEMELTELRVVMRKPRWVLDVRFKQTGEDRTEVTVSGPESELDAFRNETLRIAPTLREEDLF